MFKEKIQKVLDWFKTGLMKVTRKSPYFNAGMDRVCYNKDVLTITKLDVIIIKYPMATWDYGFGN